MKSLKEQYLSIRKKTLEIVAPLEIEDYCIQPILQVSPPKWHLAHTTWFFERLILEKFVPNYKSSHPEYYHLFNSYYKSLGTHWTRIKRGSLSRPTVKEIQQYRSEIDHKIMELLNGPLTDELKQLLILGLNHEQQHQELLFMDIKNIFFTQYGNVSYATKSSLRQNTSVQPNFIKFEGGFMEMGTSGTENPFAYDNEGPKHKAWLNPFEISNQLVSNEDYLEFVETGGYSNPDLWLSDGWTWIQENSIGAPLYWTKNNDSWFEFGFYGLEPLNPKQPVMHLSYYEAQAYARYRGYRLPTEYEWEFTAQKYSLNKSGCLSMESFWPEPASSDFEDLHGRLWQWTQSSYLPYPGHQWSKGPLGEYNSKFMVNQMVLRGGCFVTEKNHYRPTYRNYFYPHERWAFTGLRLAGDL
ncbi:MAG: ergothioneine biosynthesis protein EgtB [Pseudobdellovibrionaceae bacterium]